MKIGVPVVGSVLWYVPKAIDFDEERAIAITNSVLCQGCGTCVAACPAGAIKGNHFTAEELLAEIQGVLT